MLEALAKAVGEGGVMSGWQVHNIGQLYEEDSCVRSVLVFPMKEVAEVIKTAVKKEQTDFSDGKAEEPKLGKKQIEGTSGSGQVGLAGTGGGPAPKKRLLENGVAHIA
ncbi:MAG: hypothetical protein Q9218_002660 [Villophora microphyllina]